MHHATQARECRARIAVGVEAACETVLQTVVAQCLADHVVVVIDLPRTIAGEFKAGHPLMRFFDGVECIGQRDIGNFSARFGQPAVLLDAPAPSEAPVMAPWT